MVDLPEVSFLVRLAARFFVPTHASKSASRAAAVEVGRRADLDAHAAAARPRLEGCEHEARIGGVGAATTSPSAV